MAGKSKARTIIVRMISTAKTGYFYSTQRLRIGPKLAAVKYDPRGKCLILSAVNHLLNMRVYQ
ncbi:54S ribosomal protein L39, mitochondrial [Sparassis crispa]|uniref:Large ribosomal subunit protein bL33m n=1 Tax=Sparassis crispa TaxID=139825 RepID=A0A401GLC6_9APHY|nr:54S ribosomal protein L39, mitochondrial [Sparassis crispa]GBE82977.1 54S ribosomal protein L39, mitochondrial [Sparassis crispa]